MIEGLKPYAEYKESGQAWLGQLPASWSLRRAKFLFREVDERSRTGKEELLSVSHKTGVTPRSQKNVTMFMAESNVGHKICRPQDLVINTLWAWMAALGVSKHTGIVSPAYGVYRPINTEAFLPRFADQLLRTPFYADEYQRRSTGVNSSRLRLYPEAFFRIPVVLPPPEEQAAIVRFLNHANRKIDGFIRAKRKLIGLLNEQKQAIIHRAVTRGLDPDVPLKPSGIPWLGDIPAHWDARAFARMSRVVRGSSPRPAGDKRFFNGDFMPWVTVGEVTKDREMYLKSTGTFLTQLGAERSTMFPAGTLILTNSGATLGVPKILELNACANDGIVAFLSLRSLIQKPFAYLFLSTLTRRLRDEMRQGGTQPNLNTGIVRRIVCPIPPVAEQEAILSYVERESAPLNTAIARTEREIALMQEYRTRLTADIVTGKLDVREAAAKLPDLATEPVGEVLGDEALDESETEDAEA